VAAVSVLEIIAVIAAGVVAGTINTVVGSGTLITFPVLLAVGYPPVVANVSNSIGLVPGSLTGTLGYRRELRGQRRRALLLSTASVPGGIVGAILLLVLPADAFSAIVPVLIGIALVLVVVQPWVSRKLADRQMAADATGGVGVWLGVFAAGIYGGYFGAAQGVLIVGLMGVLMAETLQRLNALKNLLAGLVNLVSGVLFVLLAHVAWLAVLLVAGGSLVGGLLGARVGRKLPPAVLRGAIVVVGLAAMTKLVLD
jgi:uncharacterized membrane protein YfcA